MMNAILLSAVNILFLYLQYLLAILAVTHMADLSGYAARSRGFYMVLAGLLTFVLFVLHQVQVSPVAIQIIAILFTALLTGYASERSLWLRLTASTLFFLAVRFITTLLGFLITLLLESAQVTGYSFKFLSLAEYAALPLIILLYIFIRSHGRDLSMFNRVQLFIVFLISIISYTVLYGLSNLLLQNSLRKLQLSVMLTLLLVGFLLVVLIMILNWITRSHHAAHEQGLLSLTNEMLESNYRQLFSNQQAIAKQVHDFNNHLLALKGLVNDSSLATEYIADLLEASAKQADTCHSGNEVIDAIINCKQNEAAALDIHFTYTINLPPSLSINSIDICAVLANLLDNALEACQKLENPQDRFIHVSIGQKYDFLFFRIENSVDANPLGDHRVPVTTKKDRSRPHGLGLKNVLDTVRRYEGALEHDYKDNRFASIAMMQLPPEDLRKLEFYNS